MNERMVEKYGIFGASGNKTTYGKATYLWAAPGLGRFLSLTVSNMFLSHLCYLMKRLPKLFVD